jgi:hypothetical protein
MTCRANGVEPYAYLCYLFEEFPKATTAEQLEALLPWNAKPLSPRLPPPIPTPNSPPKTNAPHRA